MIKFFLLERLKELVFCRFLKLIIIECLVLKIFRIGLDLQQISFKYFYLFYSVFINIQVYKLDVIYFLCQCFDVQKLFIIWNDFIRVWGLFSFRNFYYIIFLIRVNFFEGYVNIGCDLYNVYKKQFILLWLFIGIKKVFFIGSLFNMDCLQEDQF